MSEHPWWDWDTEDDDSWLSEFGGEDVRALVRERNRLREFAEDAARQFGYWVAGKTGGLTTGGLSTLEEAFAILGWDDPHPVPDRRCDEPGCMEDGTVGWPSRPGGTGLNGGYRRTCFAHSDFGRARASEATA